MRRLSLAQRRLVKEHQELAQDLTLTIQIEKPPNNTANPPLEIWKVSFRGPQDSPYCEDILQFSVAFPEDYPVRRPRFCVECDIYHTQLRQNLVWTVDWNPGCTLKQL